MRHETGVFRLASMNDDGTAYVTDNILSANPSGKVGIGTANPGSKLQIGAGGTANEGADLLLTMDPGSSGTHSPMIVLGRNGTQAHIGVEGSSNNMIAGDAQNDLFIKSTQKILLSANNGTNAHLVIANSGNVGIGTTSPGQKLSVAGTIESTTRGITFPDGTVQTSSAVGAGYTTPVLANFSWINQETATAITSGSTVFVKTDYSAADDLRILKKTAPAAPYSVTAYVKHSGNMGGILWRESSSGKMVVLTTNGSNGTSVQNYTNPNTWSADVRVADEINGGIAGVWLRITDNGTNRIASYSLDGVNFMVLHSVGRTSFLTADEVGFFVDNHSAYYPDEAGLTLYSWQEN